MTNIILSGANGKMGKVITAMAAENDDLNIVCGFDVNTESNGFPVYQNPDEYAGGADVIIDFSHPSAFENLTEYALKRKLPIIMCTTGLSSVQLKKLEEMSKEIPVFFSANMSLGINLLIQLAKKATEILNGFDIEIVERHHNQKIDAPSGTALAIADAINESMTAEAEYVYDRHSKRCKRSKNEIGIHAVRGGTIVGDHSVIFACKDEVIELNHSAHSKEVFASGALAAARFMNGKAAGFYNMTDLVNSSM
ncbi:MAG: 4-hydroxy-tetrahydrodipicolinate reductase [Clostridia bacterium]|nr:4-hydroxy-tetrahydrodipicolinate reductase [Clostridia bacterium]